MNLFVGVVVETFQRNKERSDGTVSRVTRAQATSHHPADSTDVTALTCPPLVCAQLFLTEAQQKWVAVMREVHTRRSPRLAMPPDGACRERIFFLVTSPTL